MNDNEIVNKMLEIQNLYNNNPSDFQSDEEFVKLASKLTRTRRRKPITIWKITVEEEY